MHTVNVRQIQYRQTNHVQTILHVYVINLVQLTRMLSPVNGMRIEAQEIYIQWKQPPFLHAVILSVWQLWVYCASMHIALIDDNIRWDKSNTYRLAANDRKVVHNVLQSAPRLKDESILRFCAHTFSDSVWHLWSLVFQFTPLADESIRNYYTKLISGKSDTANVRAVFGIGLAVSRGHRKEVVC